MHTGKRLAALEEAWNVLWAATPEVSGFQSHAWVETCLQQLRTESSLYLGVVERDGRPVAIFPTQLTKRGRLTFIGRGVSNYSGPVFLPDFLADSVRAWGEHLSADENVKTIDLAGLRERSPFFALVVGAGGLPGWGAPVTVATNTCPEVDLRPGWEELQQGHKSKQRSTWRRKANRLSRLGALEFVEAQDPAALEEAMPRMIELFEQRWEGQRIRGGFSSHGPFQAQAATRLAQERLALLSSLRLDGEIVAFAYGVRGRAVTSSYVLAHDDRFDRYSPGLLLLLRILEAACRRGDSSYDFSVGDVPYKSLWMTGRQEVYRAIWGRGRRRGALQSRAWARARSIDWLRELKLNGLSAMSPRRDLGAEIPDAPGLPAGRPAASRVYQLPGGSGEGAFLRPCSYSSMRDLLSPRLLSLAIERSFRGDELLIVARDSGALGIVWRAASDRRRTLAGDVALAADGDVHYHLVSLPEVAPEDVVCALADATAGMLVSPRRPLGLRLDDVGGVEPDSGAWPTVPRSG